MGYADGGANVAMLAPPDEDDGYVSPEFDLPSESEDEAPPAKRHKHSKKGPGSKGRQPGTGAATLEEEEELALQLLRSRRQP